MRGFMCQPQVSTAACLSCDSRSVVVPATRREMSMEEHTKLINKCTRIGDVPRTLGSMPISKRSRNVVADVGSSVLTISKRDQENSSKIVPSIPLSDNSFQVTILFFRIEKQIYIYIFIVFIYGGGIYLFINAGCCDESVTSLSRLCW